jgi:hypothetical protein
MRLFAVGVWAVAWFAAGCQCQDASDGDGDGDEPPPPTQTPHTDPGPAPESYGSWLSLRPAADGAAITMTSYDRLAGAVDFAIGTPGDDGAITWSHEKVDGYPDGGGTDAGDRGKYTSHATAPDGTVWVAYQDVGEGTLRVAHRLGRDNWEPSVMVDAGAAAPGDAGHWVSLAIDVDGNPTVVSCDATTAAVRLSRRTDGNWTTTTLYTSSAVGDVPAGVATTALQILGSSERIAFYDSAAGSLVLLEGAGTTFTPTVVDDAGDVGRWPSLLSIGPVLYVAYEDVENQDLKLASRTGADWTIEVVDAGQMRGADTAPFDDGGEPGIVSFDGIDNDQWVARRGPEGWELTRLAGESAMVGYHNEVVTTSAGRWAGSFDQKAGTLVLNPL